MSESLTERPATLLVATKGEWVGRALESVLAAHGYAVRRTENGRDALRIARRTKPDAIVLDQDLPEVTGGEVCRQLRDDPMFDAATPIVLITDPSMPRAEREDAYNAGAWSLCTQPIDTHILLRELSTFIRAKRAGVEHRDSSLVDSATGLLSPVGLERWAEKLAAVAERKHEPLACVVLMAFAGQTGVESADVTEMAAKFIEMSRAHMRQSDVVGRTSDGRLAMLAPDTNDAGALGFVQRLRSAIDEASKTPSRTGVPTPHFRAGYYAIDDFAAASVAPAELIRRATRAVDHAQRSDGGELTFSFNQLPLN
jgi:CheY-like chemotaxis protein